MHSLSGQSLTLVDVCETRDDEQLRRYSFEEGFELVHNEVGGLRCVERSRDVDTIHHGFWFETQFEAEVPQLVGLDEVVAVDDDGGAFESALVFGELRGDCYSKQAFVENTSTVE